MTRRASARTLRAELAQARMRLSEAEDILRAIRHGEVDAVVVHGPSGDQVYALSGTGRVYRQLIESMSEGAVTLSRDGIILYCNIRLAQMLGRPMEQVLGTMLKEHIFASQVAALDTTLSLAGSDPVSVELTLMGADGRTMPARLCATRFLGDSAEEIFCVVAMDLSEHNRRLAEVSAAERLASAILEQAADAIVVCDAQGEVIRSNAASSRLCQGIPLHRAFADAFPLTTPGAGTFDASPLFRGQAMHDLDVELPLAEHKASLILHSGPLHWNDEVIGCVISLTDITERRRAEFDSARLAAIVAGSDDAIIGRDLDNRITSWNHGAQLLFGYDAEHMVGHSLLALIPTALHASEYDVLAQLREGRAVAHYDTQWKHAAGHLVDVSVAASPIKDRAGAVIGASSAARDITERIVGERRIRYLNRVYAMLSGINILIVRTHSREQLFADACKIAVRTGGFEIAAICCLDVDSGRVASTSLAGKDQVFAATIGAMLQAEGSGLTRWAIHAAGSRHLRMSDMLAEPPLSLLRGKSGEPLIQSIVALPLIVKQSAVGVMILCATDPQFFHEEELELLKELTGDIAFAIDHIEKERQLDYLAYYDALTGLANRNLFMERVSQFVRSTRDASKQLAICSLDLERFKNINDSLGWAAGDRLLRQFVQWLSRAVADVNLLARLSGDKFALALPDVGRGEAAARFVERITVALPQHAFVLDEIEVRLSVIIGLALCPDDGIEAAILLRNAESALKKAKVQGKRYLFYDQNMAQEIASKLVLENQLRQALENGDFVLYYQPKMDYSTGQATGAEVLLRWHKAGGALILPGNFIAMLEETGLIHEVGRWVMQQAVADNQRWRTAGLAPMRLAVNFSPVQMRHPLFLEHFRQDLGANPDAASAIEIEITESCLMERTQDNIAMLSAIQAMGISIAIDDFGTGFSSLSYLIKLPVNSLKIDRSFLVDMLAGPRNLALVSTIISLAHALGIRVIAEGVENEAQSALLRLLRCDEMQGYLYSEPVARDGFEARFLRGALA